MNKPKLFLLPAAEQNDWQKHDESKVVVQELEVPEDQIAYKCPKFDWMKQFIFKKGEDGYVEHVSVYYNGKHCHMFVDENGRNTGATINWRATSIYHNGSRKAGGAKEDQLYGDVTKPASPILGPTAGTFGIKMLQSGYYIVGPALLWTGDME